MMTTLVSEDIYEILWVIQFILNNVLITKPIPTRGAP